MGPVALDLRTFLALAWRAVRRRPVATLRPLRVVVPGRPLVPAAGGCERWRDIESILDASVVQVGRVRDCQARAQRQLDAAAYALQGLLREIDGVLAASARHRPSDAALSLRTLAADERFAMSYRRARELAA